MESLPVACSVSLIDLPIRDLFPITIYFDRIQHELEVSTKQAIFVDSSISDTIRTCIVLGNHRAAMKVKTEFKVCRVSLVFQGGSCAFLKKHIFYG